jgi:hypothetical protein
MLSKDAAFFESTGRSVRERSLGAVGGFNQENIRW